MKAKRLKPVPIQKVETPGYRWPDFSAEFKHRWHREFRGLLRGNSGGKMFQIMQTTDKFRCDIFFWSEMRIWAGMAKAYADLGGDAVQGLAEALLNASCGSDQDKKTDAALVAAMGDTEVVALVLAGVADMRTRIGAEPSDWAREHLGGMVGQEGAEKFIADSGSGYL